MTVERAQPMPQTVVELEVVVLVGYVCTQHTHCKNNSIRPHQQHYQDAEQAR